MLAAIALDLYRRAGLDGVSLFGKVAADLTKAGHKTRRGAIKSGTVEDWSQELNRLGKLKFAKEEAADFVADFPSAIELDSAETVVKRLLKTK